MDIKRTATSGKALIDMLLDENNQDSIFIFDQNGREYECDQVAIIPYDDEIYVILKPIDEIEGVADDEALVCHLIVPHDNEEEAMLLLEYDEETAITVFEKYYELLDEAGIE